MELSHAFARDAVARRIARCPHCGRRAVRRPGLAAFVIGWVADNLGVSPAELRGDRRRHELVEARCMAVWAMRNLGRPISYGAIARLLGTAEKARNMSSVLHWEARAEHLRGTDPQFVQDLAALAADFTLMEENRHGLD